MDKRQFLRISSALAAGSFIPLKGEAFVEGMKKPILRTLGKTGIKIPVVSCGIIPQNNKALIKALFESGIKHFDSAWEYQNGRNDIMVGEMLREYGRDNFIISTKVLLPTDQQTGQYLKDATTAAFMEQLEITLKRLGVETVDILYLHKPPTREAALNEEMLNGLRKAKEQGKTKFVGFSSHSNQVELINTAIESNFYEVGLVGYNFRQDNIVKPALERANKAGLGIVAMKVFAGEYQAKERNKPVNKTAALKWVLQDKNVHTSILTFKTYEDFESLIPVMHDIDLTTKEKNDLALAYNETGMYCLGCEKCRRSCVDKLPVPDLMRAYMYTYGYRQISGGRKVLDEFELPTLPCSNCNICSINCTAGFDLKAKIADIVRLRNVPFDFLG